MVTWRIRRRMASASKSNPLPGPRDSLGRSRRPAEIRRAVLIAQSGFRFRVQMRSGGPNGQRLRKGRSVQSPILLRGSKRGTTLRYSFTQMRRPTTGRKPPPTARALKAKQKLLATASPKSCSGQGTKRIMARARDRTATAVRFSCFPITRASMPAPRIPAAPRHPPESTV
jgi:hypothetical protein